MIYSALLHGVALALQVLPNIFCSEQHCVAQAPSTFCLECATWNDVHVLPNILCLPCSTRIKTCHQHFEDRKSPRAGILYDDEQVAVQQQRVRCKQLHCNVAQRRVEACKAGNRVHWSETQLLRYPSFSSSLPLPPPLLTDTILSLR